ncbi:MAG: amino acid adenylation domain-containing protein, partial [Pyrinomonadaceae bacterium]
MTQAIETGHRLSPQQRRLWLLGQGGGEFRAQALLLLEGRLDRARLREAAALVVRRHEIFRTAFVRLPGFKTPVQAVCDAADPAWDVTDLRGHEPEEHPLLVEQRAAAERLRTLDLERAPLVSFSLAVLAENTHVLIVTLPSLCADERTLDNLAADLGRCYEALSEGAEPDGEVVQYAHFSEWQHELLAGEEGEAAREFWRGSAAVAFDAPPLPLESRSDEPAAYAPESLTLEVPEPLAAQVASAALSRGTTEDVLLLACWQTLVWRLTGRAEVATHVLSPGRVYEEMAEAMGLYARWPFVVTSFEEDYQFAEVVDQVGGAVASANEWQEYYSWEQLEEAAAERADESEPAGRAASPAFGFAWERADGGRRFDGVTFTLRQKRVLAERFKLRLLCRADGGALALTFQYDPASYTAQAVGLLADYFLTLLRAVVADASARVGQSDLLSERERRRLLVEWNDTRRPFPAARCVHELFAEQAARTPDALAVAACGESLTFGQLEERANRLANYLRRRGVGPDVPVVLSVERSAEMIVGLLGILKAGGAYVPLDPSYPAARLSFMLEETGAPLVLTQSHLRAALADARAVCLDTQWPEIAAESALAPRAALDPENLAYVIYTSGSTGTPKGVGVRHRSVVNLLTALRAAVYDGLEGPLRVGVNASISFDSSVKQIVQLLDGHSLHLVPEDVRPDGEALLAYVRDHGIDVLDCTPSQLRLLLDAGLMTTEPRAPRLVLVGGEAIDAGTWSLLAGQGDIKFFNVYGPTETTVDATACRIAREAVRPTIGRPIANATAYVLDGQMRPVPVGVRGELYLGGEGVARGYLGRPALTAERFVPDPFSTEPGARLYRTGDLARFGAGGEIEFIGREDGQVKVRGFRVELGEIEAALRAHDGVRDAAVVMRRDDGGGGARLVGYVVGRGGDLSVGDLKSHLRARLPEYMTPSELLLLAELPLTPNGKLDRRALLSCDASVAPRESSYVAPRTPVEEALAGVWAEVLKVGRVGVDENFFDLGGHSLLATQVVSRVRKALRVELPLRSLFESPTVAGLALSVEHELQSGEASAPPEIERVPRGGPLPLSFAQQRLWFLDQLDPGSALYNVPTVLRLAGPLDVAAFEKSLGEVVRRHEILRTTFAMRDGSPVQVIAPPGPWNLPVEDLREVPAASRQAAVERATIEEMRRPFDLTRGPLLRALLLRVGDVEHVLVFTVHHMVSDDWSKGVLVREATALYEAFLKGEPSPLAEPPIQYADFAQWHRRRMSGALLESQLDYWRRQLRGELPVLNLPTDHKRPASPDHRGAHVPFRLSASLTDALKELSRREGATLFMTLLAGFKCLLHRYADQEDILVGTPIANRTRAEIEDLIGFFVNTLVLRTDLSGDPTFRELLGRVREVTLGAYAHQDLPFEKLVEELQLSRDGGRTPLLQVVFTLQNAPVPPLALAGLTLTPQPVETGTAKFDLVLNVAETEQGLAGWLEYRCDLFERETIERLAAHFETLLGAAAADPARRLSELPLLGEGERRALLAGAGAGQDYPQALCLHELFARRAQSAPAAPAVTFEGETLSYAELNERANRLARYLRGLGVGAESRVGLLLERSAEMVIAVLGVLKAGGAYVPLDPEYPAERLSFMLADSGARVALTDSGLAARLPADSGARVVCLDAERELIAAEAKADPGVALDPANAAYVIYTSGSTGTPKGVVVTHANVGRLMASCEPRFAFSPADVWTLFHSYAFDFSVWELWGALLYGGRLVVVPYWVARSPEAFLDLLSEQGVTVLSQTPSAFRQLAAAEGRAGEAGRPLSLRAVVFGGEALEPASLRGWVERRGDSSPALVNMYGITETCVHVTYRRVRAPEVEGGGSSLVGVALSDLRLYALDRRLEPVPEGVAGELFVGGAGLARGYLNRPGLTAERFVPDPFSTEPGARLYRTGDVGRWVAAEDGGREVEYLGRCDQQVKVRGYRIELGEIEAALLAHAAVAEGVVVAREATPGDTRLVAYYVAAEGVEEVGAAELRAHLAGRLPGHMTPSHFVRVGALPLTPNGKLDRRALPEPEAPGGGEYVAARTEVERRLCE